jgi:hypothetical protein
MRHTESKTPQILTQLTIIQKYQLLNMNPKRLSLVIRPPRVNLPEKSLLLYQMKNLLGLMPLFKSHHHNL